MKPLNSAPLDLPEDNQPEKSQTPEFKENPAGLIIEDIRNHFFEPAENEEDEMEKSDIRHIEQSGTYEKAEQVARRPVLAIGDLDADFSSLVKIMDKAGYIAFENNPGEQQKDIRLREKGLAGTVVQTGDFFDRGKDLLTMLEFISTLRENGVDFRMTAGNHDLMALYAFSCPSVVNADPDFYRLVKDTIRICHHEPGIDPQQIANAVIKNDLIHKRDGNSHIHHSDVLNFINWYFEGGRNFFKEMQAPEHHHFDKHNPTLREHLEKAHQLMFGDSIYARTLQKLSVFEPIDDVLYLHAGIDDYWADMIEEKGIDRLNAEFREDLAENNLKEYVFGIKRHAFWRRHSALTPNSAQVIKNLGFKAVVRGHDITASGQPESHTEYGVKVVNIDIGIKTGKLGGALITADNKIEGFTAKKHLLLGNLPPLKRIVPLKYEPKAKSA